MSCPYDKERQFGKETGMAKAKDKEIKEVVRNRYAARAKGAVVGAKDEKMAVCCGTVDPSTGAYPGIYLGTELTGMPNEVLMASAGCGNPTALADLKPGEVVLDLGSGGGIDCFLASRAVGPSGRVLGVDMTPEMVELARKNAKRLRLGNVEFRLGEIEALPVEPATVDVVISNCVVCLSPDKDAVLREASRVLKPGGRLHLSDMMLVGELPQAIKDDPQKWAECVSGADQKDTYLARLRAAGFRDVSVEGEQAYTSEPGLESLRSVHVRALKPK